MAESTSHNGGKHAADAASDDAGVAIRTRQVRGPRPGYERSADEDRGSRVREMLGPRAIGLFVACLFLQAAFIASYVGAFHDPTPHDLQVTVVAPQQVRQSTVARLNAIDGSPVKAEAASTEAQARKQLSRGQTQAVYIVNPTGTQDTLLVAGAEGSSLTGAAELVFRRVGAAQQRTLIVQDLVPAQAKDGRGLTSFYLVVGWLVGGYLAASLIGISAGNRSRNFRRACWRVGGGVIYAAVSGIVGALIVDTWFGSLTGHFWELAALGTLVVLSAILFTYGASALLGIIGVGLAIVLFVVLGNPSAGGAYAFELLPEPWSTIGPWLPNGAGVHAVRSLVYFDGAGVGRDLLVLAAWALIGLVTYFAVAGRVYWGMKRDVWGPDDEPAGRHKAAAQG